ncbi:hypothetical protein BpHYR1_024789 [Brachionus plicatilis]|uniref:Uncharacterized protein n=1 Tax=Brachionus plicatilis TaxID=10195 RepID=A0A3M7PVN9_BRAPC|nr:hypothetical protein BpHYR1_024789 [Brachionus plicatilis]
MIHKRQQIYYNLFIKCRFRQIFVLSEVQNPLEIIPLHLTNCGARLDPYNLSKLVVLFSLLRYI